VKIISILSSKHCVIVVFCREVRVDSFLVVTLRKDAVLRLHTIPFRGFLIYSSLPDHATFS
jgi:hypothetical protein